MSAATVQALPPDDAAVVIVPMLTTSRAVDLYLGDISRRGYSRRTISTYRRLLDKFTDTVRDDEDVTAIRPDDCRRFLDQWGSTHAQGTKAHAYTVLNTFLEWLYLQQRIKRNPLDHVPRPRRLPAEDLDVVTVSTSDARRLLREGHTWTEKLAVAIPAYMGPRRHAVALLRLRDWDRQNGQMRFREKGAKTVWRPIPDELLTLLEAARADGAFSEPDDYLIPPEGYVTKDERDDRVIWRVVRRVAARAGVDSHVHALRAAFATFYLEQNPGDLEALQALMGHRSLATTQTYLRKLNRRLSMERVRTLSWGVAEPENLDEVLLAQIAGKPFASSLSMGAGGFEPPSSDFPGAERPGTQHPAASLEDDLSKAALRGEASLSSRERDRSAT